MKKVKILSLIIGGIIVIVFLSTYLTMSLWNWLMPELFNLIKIDFWQAFGINMLSYILFSSKSYYNSKN